MSYNVALTDNFKREAKKLIKKYASLRGNSPNYLWNWQITRLRVRWWIIISMLAIASKNKGKSGGARVMTYVAVTETTVLFFSIYDKGEKETISDKEIRELLKAYL